MQILYLKRDVCPIAIWALGEKAFSSLDSPRDYVIETVNVCHENAHGPSLHVHHCVSKHISLTVVAERG